MMKFDLFSLLGQYWSEKLLIANIIIILHLIGSLALGLIIGYERAYNGRAAGMRTYGLVAMGSTGLIVVLGHPEYWYGAQSAILPSSDPTRVIQGIVTGLGFLCAGVIIKDNFSITGLTTAASIWSCAVIGILVGLGFYIVAICFTILQFGLMFWLFRLETILPSKHSLMLSVVFKKNEHIHIEQLIPPLAKENYVISPGSLNIDYGNTDIKISFQASSEQKPTTYTIIAIANNLKHLEHVQNVNVSYSRH
jgi:putative Mg2+ transporter-C (MgtC) family protein